MNNYSMKDKSNDKGTFNSHGIKKINIYIFLILLNRYSGESISVLALRPKRTASSPVWVVCVIFYV